MILMPPSVSGFALMLFVGTMEVENVIVQHGSAVFVADQSQWLIWNTDPTSWTPYNGVDFRYIAAHSTPVLDSGATLITSIGGIMNYGSAGIRNNKVCSDCHSSSHTRYMRTPKLWPKVIPVPGAVPAMVPNDGTGSTTITVTISDPDNNVSGVTIDLTALGGSSTQAMTNNGGGIFSYLLTVASGKPDVPYELVVTATDSDANTGKGRMTLLVVEPEAIYLDDPQAIFVPDCTIRAIHLLNGISTSTTEQFGTGFRYKAMGDGTGTATWTPLLPHTGQYQVYAWWDDCHTIGDSQKRRSQHVPYTVYYDGGSQRVEVDQTDSGPGGGRWNLLGTWAFVAGTSGYVVLSDDATPAPVPGSTTWVVGDAIKFKPVP